MFKPFGPGDVELLNDTETRRTILYAGDGDWSDITPYSYKINPALSFFSASSTGSGQAFFNEVESNVKFYSSNKELPESYWGNKSADYADDYDLDSLIYSHLTASGSLQQLATMAVGAYKSRPKYPPEGFAAADYDQSPDRTLKLLYGTQAECIDKVEEITSTYLRDSVLTKHYNGWLTIIDPTTPPLDLPYEAGISLVQFNGPMALAWRRFISTTSDGVFWPSASTTNYTSNPGGLGYGPWAFPQTWGFDAVGSDGYKSTHIRDSLALGNIYSYYYHMLAGTEEESVFRLPTSSEGFLVSTETETGTPFSTEFSKAHRVHVNPAALTEILVFHLGRDLNLDGAASLVAPYSVDLSSVLGYGFDVAVKSPIVLVLSTRISNYPLRYLTDSTPGVQAYVDFVNLVEVQPNTSDVWQVTSTITLNMLTDPNTLESTQILCTYPCGLFYRKHGALVLRLSSVQWEQYRSGSSDYIYQHMSTDVLAHGLTPSTIAWTSELVPSETSPGNYSYPVGTLHYSGSAFLGTYNFPNLVPLNTWPYYYYLGGDTGDTTKGETVYLSTRSTYKDLVMGYKSRLVFAAFETKINGKITAYKCQAEKEEFNFSNNPTSLDSTRKMQTVETSLDDEDVVTGSTTTPVVTHPSQAYITKVGLYNNRGDLVATAALSKPVRKSFENSVTISVRLPT